MAISNHERVRKALDLLKEGLGPVVEREINRAVDNHSLDEAVISGHADDKALSKKPVSEWDAAGLLRLMWKTWDSAFKNILGPAELSLVNEIRELRDKWSDQKKFSSDDALRALDTVERLLAAISSPLSGEVQEMRMELLRVRFEEHARSKKRKQAGSAIKSSPDAKFKPWREIVTPHEDVASGNYQQAEFAADLWQVYQGKGTDEYRDPVEFFRRTYMTESLKRLMINALLRFSNNGGDPVVQLQTNFGGGKTHSMLALYHLFSGEKLTGIHEIEAVLHETQISNIPKAKRVVLVGNQISPGNPVTKKDGTVVRTLWGELAWQLGGKEAYSLIGSDDKNATNPGHKLSELFEKFGPCFILIDEWVAYARQLVDRSDLPAGRFETQFTFAQTLTESVKAANKCFLVISLPASQDAASSHTQTDDVEVGGSRGREALNRLHNVIGRIESSWRPASADESFEIVRRRLFKPFSDQTQYKDRDIVAQGFADLYRSEKQEFPQECGDSDYEMRIRGAYPIHPEIFDRLYTDWSTLDNFQRTRGVLRLMAAVIHSLWEKNDRSPMILPAHISIDDTRVQNELTRYLPDNWKPIVEIDVDGHNSLPLKIDEKVSNLGKYAATRRVARVIFLGTAPTVKAAHHGLEDQRIKLGSTMPGESPSVFGDALRRLAGTATYLYQDGTRYWYSTQPTVSKLARERADQFKREPDKIASEIESRMRIELQSNGEFSRIHAFPKSGLEIPDELETRLVVLGINQSYVKEEGSDAIVASDEILKNRGSSPRIFRNTLVFLAADKTRLQELDDAIRKFLAWESICNDSETLDLSPNQVKQAESQKSSASNMVDSQIPETYKWLLVPFQEKASSSLEWQSTRMPVQGSSLSDRVFKKLRSDEMLITKFAATRLKMDLDRIPLWREDHVTIKQVIEYFAQYTYLPRVTGPKVLLNSIMDGLSNLNWDTETFAYADSYDPTTKRYLGLRHSFAIDLPDEDSPGLLVEPGVARKQIEADKKPDDPVKDPITEPESGGGSEGPSGDGNGHGGTDPGLDPDPDPNPPPPGPPPPGPPSPKRYFGVAELDATRAGRDAGKISEEVISHLDGLTGAEVSVTLEIHANLPSGAPEQVVRTVTENSKALNFKESGFEEE